MSVCNRGIIDYTKRIIIKSQKSFIIHYVCCKSLDYLSTLTKYLNFIVDVFDDIACVFYFDVGGIYHKIVMVWIFPFSSCVILIMCGSVAVYPTYFCFCLVFGYSV